jgi:hypothetical protein
VLLGGLVLTRCSLPYLQQAFGPGWASDSPPRLRGAAEEFPRRAGEEVVVVCHDEGFDGTQGYRPGRSDTVSRA